MCCIQDDKEVMKVGLEEPYRNAWSPLHQTYEQMLGHGGQHAQRLPLLRWYYNVCVTIVFPVHLQAGSSSLARSIASVL